MVAGKIGPPFVFAYIAVTFATAASRI